LDNALVKIFEKITVCSCRRVCDLEYLKVSDAAFPFPVAVSGGFRTLGAADFAGFGVDAARMLRQGFLLLIGMFDSPLSLLVFVEFALRRFFLEDFGLFVDSL